MKLTQIVDHVLFMALRIEEARQFLKDGPRVRTVAQLGWARIRREPWLLEFLSERTVGEVFMLAALTRLGSCENEEEFDLLGVYCFVSDNIRTQRRAIEHLLGEERLHDCLHRGLQRVKARGIYLDVWMARSACDGNNRGNP
jgi:hypothetical protein